MKPRSISKKLTPPAPRLLDENHLDMAASLESLGSLSSWRGELDKARDYFRRSIEIREHALGPESSPVGDALNALGIVHAIEGDYDGAEGLFLKSRDALEASEGGLSAGKPIGNLANVYALQGRYEEALPLQERVVELHRESFGANHFKYGRSLQSLGVIHKMMGETAKAEPRLKQALEIFRRSEGPDHPDVGTVLTEMGEVYAQQGRFAESERRVERGASHPHRGAGQKESSGGRRSPADRPRRARARPARGSSKTLRGIDRDLGGSRPQPSPEG